VIQLNNVTKVYPANPKPALSNISLEIARGEFAFLVGTSGSGKSTFLRLLLREELPTVGTLQINGRDLARMPTWKVPQLRRQIGCVFQDFRLLPDRSVTANIAFAPESIGRPQAQIRKLVPEVLDLVGLTGKGDRMPGELSGGEQQRVAIARAFINRPLMLLCDEPTGNLDPGTAVGIMRLLDRINRTGTTIVMATHDDEIVNELRKRVVQFEDGRKIRDHAEGVYSPPTSAIPLNQPVGPPTQANQRV
jgi:cell division transport system ATP-binding protein